MEPVTITFQPKWKEELVCDSALGSFVLEMPMGIVSVYFPTEDTWRYRAPHWAVAHYASILAQLRNWCEKNGVPLYVEESAQVYEQ